MKELSIEEKAKAYDSNYKTYTELINWLEDVKDAIKKQNYGIAMDMLCKPYPEYQIITSTEPQKSEDEGVRGTLYEYFKRCKDSGDVDETWYGISYDKILSWLEKQGEQKNFASKQKPKFKVGDVIRPKGSMAHYTIESISGECYHGKGWELHTGCENDYELVEQKPADTLKFKVGDWITDGVSKCQIRFIDDTQYWYSENCILGRVEYVDKRYHLWTIQDAKDGDVLTVENIVFIYKRILSSHIVSYCDLIDGKFNSFEYGRICCEGNTFVHPATKEQCDLLFKKMKESGYEWDTEKKELKKIEQKPTIEMIIPEESLGIDSETYNKIVDECVYGEQNPAWSEEDESMLQNILECLKNGWRKLPTVVLKYESWFQSIKERVQPQSKYEWKQENTDALTDFENVMMHIGISFFGQHAGLNPNDTNAIKEQANILLGLVPQQEWSKEDEKMLHWLCRIVHSQKVHKVITLREESELGEWMDKWLNHNPQNTWKPSDEQMKALSSALSLAKSCGEEYSYDLRTLYEQLKKLMGQLPTN